MSKGQKRVFIAVLALWVGLWVVLQMVVALQEEERLARQLLMLDEVRLGAGGEVLPVAAAVDGGEAPASAGVDPKGAVAAAMASRLRHLSACVMTSDGSRAPVEVVLTKGEGGWQVSAVRGARVQAPDLACVQGALAPVQWPDLPGDEARLALLSLAEGGQAP